MCGDTAHCWRLSHDVVQALKLYEVINFDMVNSIPLAFTPSCCTWIHQKGAPRTLVRPMACRKRRTEASWGGVDGHCLLPAVGCLLSASPPCAFKPQLAIGDKASSLIRIFNPDASTEPVATLTFHRSPVTVMTYSNATDTVISGDESGVLEYWRGSTFDFPADRVKFKHKYSTDLYNLAAAKTKPTSLAVSNDGKRFAVTSSDAHIRVFRFSTGKLVREYDERIPVFEAAQRDGTLKIDAIDFGRRVAFEKELQVPERAVVGNGHLLCRADAIRDARVDVVRWRAEQCVSAALQRRV